VDFETELGKRVARDKERTMPILLWLLGIPLPLIILVLLLR
jgi:hypothetical protein